MKISVLIPHFKVGPMIAYSVSQYLKYKGDHDLRVVVINNSYPDKSIEYLAPFKDEITILDHITDKTNSHGVAYDFALPHVKTEYFITAESDSYPTGEYLNYYEDLIKRGFDGAGSALLLSGGQYIHPCAALYSKKTWLEAKEYCNNIQYAYFPNIAMKDGHACHLMVHNRILDEFIKHPERFVELAESYKGHTPLTMTKAMENYSPVVGPFHNGTGNNQESILTYGQRKIDDEVPEILLNNERDTIFRLGMEPGQWLTYWSLAMGKKIYSIPTYGKWMPGREGQQQEFTKTENGILHIWGISAYHKVNIPGMEDIIDHKANKVKELYNSLPEEQKINI